jgi:hypothetical protein
MLHDFSETETEPFKQKMHQVERLLSAVSIDRAMDPSHWKPYGASKMRTRWRSATVFVAKGDIRHPQFVEWSNTANPRLWKFGVSSDNRQGIWISYVAIWRTRKAGPDVTLPPRLALSEEALRAMAAVDDERNGKLASDEAAE